MVRTKASLSPYLDQLAEHGLDLVAGPTPTGSSSDDQWLTVKGRSGRADLVAIELKSHLTHENASRLVHSLRPAADARRRPLVLAPYIGRGLGARLAAAGIGYLDRQGNCHLALGRTLIHVEGRGVDRSAIEHHGIRAAGYQVLFAYLADADLLDAPLREVATAAGASRHAAQEMRRRLVAERYLVETRGGTRWSGRRRDDALGRWLDGYRSVVRPRLLRGSYRTPDPTPDDLERRIAPILDVEQPGWRWGGTAAGFRLVPHYRGEVTAIHLPLELGSLPRTLRAAPAREPNLVLLGGIGTVSWPTRGQVVHPLLVYSEMLVDGDERAREAADRLFEAHIAPTWTQGP